MLTEANGGAPDKYADGDALHGALELLVAARVPSRCHSLQVPLEAKRSFGKAVAVVLLMATVSAILVVAIVPASQK